MKFKELIFIIIIAILVLSLFGKPAIEKFTLTAGRRHAVMNEHNAIMYVSDKTPCQRGDYSCYPVTCPAVYEKDVVCWRCQDMVDEPQYGWLKNY